MAIRRPSVLGVIFSTKMTLDGRLPEKIFMIQQLLNFFFINALRFKFGADFGCGFAFHQRFGLSEYV